MSTHRAGPFVAAVVLAFVACGGVNITPPPGGDDGGSTTGGTTTGTSGTATTGGSTGSSTGAATGTTSGSTGDTTGEPALELGPLGAGLATASGTNLYGTADGPRGTARFRNPTNVVTKTDGSVIVADFDNGRLRTMAPDGSVSTLTSQPGFSRPFGLTFTPNGTLWVQTDRNETGADTGGLWRVDTTTGVATIVESGIGRPRGMASLSDGRIVMVFYLEHVVRIYDPSAPAGSRLTLLAGAAGMAGFADGVGGAAKFSQPYDAAVLPGDVIVVSDLDNNRVRQVALDGTVTTYAGDGTGEVRDGALSGGGVTARLHGPQGLAADGNGGLYVSEAGGYVVRRIKDGVATTIAGDGHAGFADGTDPMTGRFFGLEGLDVTSNGQYVYVADGDRGNDLSYHRVRRIDLSP